MGNQTTLDSAQRIHLLEVARTTIAATARGEKVPIPEKKVTLAIPPSGLFVSLHLRTDQSLRGCIGSFKLDGSIETHVARLARAASNEDPRFEGVRPDEISNLHIEISVLSPSTPMEEADQIEIGVHGLTVQHHEASGVLLPQVATQQNWSPTEFLEAVCHKAGLSPGTWRDPQCKIELFSAEVFGEQ